MNASDNGTLERASENCRDGGVKVRTSALLGAVVVVAIGVASFLVFPFELGIFTAYTCCLTAISICIASARGSIFDPWGFFFQYAILTTLSAVLVAATIGFADGFLPADLISTRLLVILAVFFTALAVGLLSNSSSISQVNNRRLPLRGGIAGVTFVAYALIGAPALYRVGLLSVYGPGSWSVDKQFATGLLSQIDVAASLFPLIGISLLLFVVQEKRVWVIPGAGAFLLFLWITVSLVLGTRDEVLGPIILILWAYNYRRRRINWIFFLGIFVLGFSVLAFVGLVRAGNEIAITSDLIRPIASGVNTTALTVDAISRGGALLYGDSYLAAIANIIPGVPLAGIIGLEPAASAFRGLTNYSGASGLGYSPIAEAYWNFGLVGAVLVPVAVGWIVTYAHARANAFPTRPIHLLYPIILCRIPIALRSDFLQQAKGVVIVILALWIIYMLMYKNRSNS